MSVIRIKRHGALMNATALTAAALSVVIAATATIVLKYDPGQVAAANADHDFQSQNTAIATVSAVGVVTGVAVGSTVVHVTNKFNGLIVDVPVTVTATE
jgi:predicted membrane protein